MSGRGWCRHPRVDPAGVGARKLERANGLGCSEHRPVWWISQAEWKNQQESKTTIKRGMLFLLDE